MSAFGILGDIGAILTAGALAWHGARNIETIGLLELVAMSIGALLVVVAVIGNLVS